MTPHRYVRKGLVVIALGYWPCWLSAQQLIAVRTEPQESSIGQTMQVLVDFKSLGVKNGACGLLIDFGDGNSQIVRVEEGAFPVQFTHTYARAGAFSVQASGKAIFKGLSSVLGCLGGAKAIAVNIRPDDYAAKLAEENAAKEAALKKATADRAVADAMARKAAAERAAAEAAVKNSNTTAVRPPNSRPLSPATGSIPPPAPNAPVGSAGTQTRPAQPTQPPAQKPPAKAQSAFEL